MGLLKKDDRYIYLDADYMEFYIPNEFFLETKKYAVDYSNYIDTFGIFHAGIFESGKLKEFKVLKQPYTIRVYVYDFENRVVELPSGPESCRVLKYTKGAKMVDSKIIQDSQNALDYFDMLTGGKLPVSVPYDAGIEIMQKMKSMNKVNFGVRSEVEETIIALHYRNPNNLSETFSKVYGADKAISPYDYATADTRSICQYASTFSSLTFEDIDTMLTASINRSRKGGKENYSPVEQIIKM